MIIVLEGIDNSGKTTIAKFLYDYFQSQGKRVTISRELTTKVGEVIKDCIKNEGLSSISKTFLFAADRQIRLEQLKDIDNPDEITIFDRYLHSAIVYREAEGLNGVWVKEINRYVPKSDFSFYIDITPEESIKRNTDTKFNIPYTLTQLDKVRKAYLDYVNKGELTLINGMRNIEYVQNDIIKTLENKGMVPNDR